MSFKDAVVKDNNSKVSNTKNGMKAWATSNSKVLDLFGNVGSSRGNDVSALFWAAYTENEDLTLRLLQWLRDVRGGAGERQQFRNLLGALDSSHPNVSEKLMHKIPLLGRWDDLFAYTNPVNRRAALEMFADAIRAEDQLAAKWAPREKSARSQEAYELRKVMGLSRKSYRKMLVRNTNVVESLMCSRNWNDINFSHVPSVAASRYQKAFGKNAGEKYAAYLNELQKPTAERDPKVKINAGAVYPYDVLKSVLKGNAAVADEQWKALPNYIGDAKILPMVDVSGSMGSLGFNNNGFGSFGSRSSISPIDISVSLGIYCAEKNTGPFSDTFLTFSGRPELTVLKGTLSDRVRQLSRANWGMNTNLEAAFQSVLDLAVRHDVSAEDMPDMILILSDMQFDSAIGYRKNLTALEMIRAKYESAGYKMPAIVFWNLSMYGSENTPVKVDDRGVVLVSGFNPNLMETVLEGNFEDYTPYNMMCRVLMKERYDY